MSRIDAVYTIRDPLHGAIEVSKEERTLLETPEVQRLRRVNQVSTSSLVFPGATHTRFSHSLGVMHLAGEIADSIGMNDRSYRTVRLAGLLHDIGHGPFSHSSDRVATQLGYAHEDRSCELLRAHLSGLIPTDIEVEEIIDYIQGDAEVNIISGDIDADRMDYLNRDSLNTGLEHGTTDYRTIVEAASHGNGGLAFNRRAIHSLNALLTARLQMHLQVNDNHAARVAENILQQVLSEYAEQHTVKEMMRHDDYTMHAELLSMEGRIRDMYERVKNRDLPKEAYAITGDAVSTAVIGELSRLDPRQTETAIATTAGIHPDKVFVVCPDSPSASSLDVSIEDSGEFTKLSTVSTIPQNLADERVYHARFNVYTPAEHLPAVTDAAEAVVTDRINAE